jgi:hypothetical protein
MWWFRARRIRSCCVSCRQLASPEFAKTLRGEPRPLGPGAARHQPADHILSNHRKRLIIKSLLAQVGMPNDKAARAVTPKSVLLGRGW